MNTEESVKSNVSVPGAATVIEGAD